MPWKKINTANSISIQSRFQKNTSSTAAKVAQSKISDALKGAGVTDHRPTVNRFNIFGQKLNRKKTFKITIRDGKKSGSNSIPYTCSNQCKSAAWKPV